MPTVHRRLTTHTALTVQPQRLVHNGCEYLTAPVVMIVEGVLNGGYVPGAEIAACAWNGVPLVCNHPVENGVPVSANDPTILATYGIGRIFRTTITEQGPHNLVRAQAELWLDIAQAQAIGGEAIQALDMIESQTPLEVSTGFYCDTTQERGSFHGTPYHEIHRNLRADHLALLPNQVGACSWADGCGAPRLNLKTCGASCQCGGACQRSPMEPQTFQQRLQRLMAMLRLTRQASGEETLIVAQTDQDTREAIYGALAREMGADYTPIFIDSLDMEALSFTYRQGERLRRRQWQMDDGVLTLSPDVEDVQRSTTYTPVPMAAHSPQATEETPPMATLAVITSAIQARANALIHNAQTGWTETDRPMLEGMSEAALIRLEAQPVRTPAVAARQPETVDEAIAQLPAHLQDSMRSMARAYEARKTAAIATLTANQACPFAAEELQTMTAERLEALVAMSSAATSYAGNGLPYQRAEPEDNTPPPAPDTFALAVARQQERTKQLH